MFPENFNLKIYRENNNDLKNLLDENLLNHYNLYGINEGRICSIFKNRNDLAHFIKKCNFKSCLEIGPFDCPVISGKNVKYFDVLNKEELYLRALKINRIHNLNNIPFIDYYDKNSNLNIIKNKFNLILSCHCIEHQTDFIQHLIDVENLLLPDGYYIIILPDKRYCFDHFIKETTIADIIDNHINNKKFHSIKSIIEHRALTCHNDTDRHWKNDHGKQHIEMNTDYIKNCIEEYYQSKKNDTYIDVHSLQFIPKTFENILNILNELKYINLKIEKIYPTLYGSNEFFVILKK